MPGRRRHTVVLSDVHLSQTHPRDDSDPLWMRYRWSDYHPDADFEGFIEKLLERCDDDDEIELVFNGDLLDFDAPMVVGIESTSKEYPLDDAGCTEHAVRILRDHPRFVRAVAKVLAGDHRVLFMSGNHDVELYWPGVRRAIREVLRDAVSALGHEIANIEERVRFRAWFHLTEDRIYLEHGSQYDTFNGVPDPMTPLAPGRAWIHPVCGKLAFKRTGARMGYFNPYCEDTFYMGLFGYLRHFVVDYLLSKRHIVRHWALGATSTVLEIVRHRRSTHDLSEESIELAITETGATREAILATHALRVPSAERAMLPILRELWLDRVGLALLMLVVIGGCFAFASVVAGAIAAGICVALFVAYELLTPKPDIRTYDSAPPTVRQIFEIHDARALCMGHTHRPVGTWTDGRFWGNSGAWCPAFVDRECTKPVLDGRPFLWLTSEEDDLSGGLHWFRDRTIVRHDRSEVPARTKVEEHV
jgi:UDP-2,3-diacylglucosamine pyrophosphatase LpxH